MFITWDKSVPGMIIPFVVYDDNIYEFKTFAGDSDINIWLYYILGMFKPIGNQYVGQVTIRYFTVSYSDIMQAIRYLKAYRMDLCKQCPTTNHHRVSKPHPQAICNTLLRFALECYIPFITFCYITCLKWHSIYLCHHRFKIVSDCSVHKNRHTFNSDVFV